MQREVKFLADRVAGNEVDPFDTFAAQGSENLFWGNPAMRNVHRPAIFDQDAAFGAYPIAPAGRIDVHTGFHGGAQQALSLGNRNRFFMGQKGYTGHSQLLHDNGCLKVAFIKTAPQGRFLSYTCSSSFRVSKRQLNVSISPS